MLTMTHYYVVISESEMGDECREILGIYRECGAVSQLASDCYTVRTFSAEEQEKLYDLFAEAMKVDFPAEDAAPADEPPATVHSIITAALRRLGVGVLRTEGCGCGCGLAPCGPMGMECVPAGRMTIAEAIARPHDVALGFPCDPDETYCVPLNSTPAQQRRHGAEGGIES